MNNLIKVMLFAAVLLSGCGAAVVADRPVAEATVAPASPGPRYVWVNDSWEWDGRSRVYVMRPGYWVEPKRTSAVWVDGQWVQVRGGWKYVRGHWRYN